MSFQDLIVDEWLSELISVDAEALFLGYRPSDDEDDGFPFCLYDMIIEPIRLSDSEQGNLLLQRFLTGPQDIIEYIWTKIKSIPYLRDPTLSPDELLPLLMRYVGYVSNAYSIVDVSSNDEMRRLAIGSIYIWKNKGTTEGYRYICELLSGRDMLFYDWFYYRPLLDHTIVGDMIDGLSYRSIPNEDTDYSPERVFEIHVADDGNQTINKELLIKLFDLCRVTNERLLVVYSLFIEKFYKNGKTKWVDLSNVLSGWNSEDCYISIQEGTNILVDSDYSSEWTKYYSRFVMRYTEENSSCLFKFYSTSDGSRSLYVRMTFSFPNTTISIGKISNGIILEPDYSSVSDFLSIERWTTFRVQTEHNFNLILVTIYMDGLPVVSGIYNSSFTRRGTVGFSCSSGSFDIKEVEIWDPSQYSYIAPKLVLRPKYIIISSEETIGFNEQDGVDNLGRISGGDGDFTFSFVENASGGTITDGGLYTSGEVLAGSCVDKVRVTDSRGNYADSTIVVSA